MYIVFFINFIIVFPILVKIHKLEFVKFRKHILIVRGTKFWTIQILIKSVLEKLSLKRLY